MGDSRAVVGRLTGNKWKTIPISKDQKPDDLEERARVDASGGRVAAFRDLDNKPIGPARIWVRGSNPPVPGLAMSRSLGDSVAASVGVIASPVVMEHRITP